ncbi:MAG: peptide ABC transporter substrate-binding protein [Rhodospirillaceae bacterium]|nr:MAG: peptide ABC transporter substrate-binding protein [Rhodospirillaceae bacterium]
MAKTGLILNLALMGDATHPRDGTHSKSQEYLPYRDSMTVVRVKQRPSSLARPRLWALCLILLATGMLAAGIASAVANETLRRGNGTEPGTLDPLLTDSEWEREIANDMFLGLTTEDTAGKPIPGAAESWTVSADGLVWTFKLRPGLAWSDGVPLTASDFVLSFRRLLDPKTAAKYASIQYVIKNAAAVNSGKMPLENLGVHAPDDRTVEITLEAPTPYLPGLMSHTTAMPVPERVIRRFGENWVKPAQMVSNGAYVLAEDSPHNYVRLTKNPRFYDAAHVAIDEVIFYPIEDENVALTRFRARELDINVTTSGFPINQLSWLQQNMPGEAHIVPALANQYLVFNLRRPPFDDSRVRRAVSLCIDREILTAKVLKDGSTSAYAFVPPGIANYPNPARLDFASWPMVQRIAEAKRLLAEAGYNTDHPFTVEHRYMNSVASRRMAIAGAAMLKECGIIVHLLVNEPKVFYRTIQEGDFSMATAMWGADYNDAQNFLYLLDSRSVGFNYGGYSNPKFDVLLDQARTEIDVAKRAALLSQAEQIALDEVAVAPLNFPSTRTLVAPYVKGYVDNAVNSHPTRWMRLER